MLGRTGFSPHWVKWIEGCVKSASISVLVNGSPTSEFLPQKGLRQGDPLAPFLFNIVAEGLNGLMRRAEEENLFKGYLVGANYVPISILQYADDTIFFGEACMENVEAIKVMLRSFELVSGLKINFAKSSFGAFGVSAQWKHLAAKYLNCSLMAFPFVYLGIPIGANPRHIPHSPNSWRSELQLASLHKRRIALRKALWAARAGSHRRAISRPRNLSNPAAPGRAPIAGPIR